MALKIDNKYIRIDGVNGDKTNIQMLVSEYDENNTIDFIKQNVFKFSPTVDNNSANFIKQGYEYLKTLDKFRGAKDC